MASAGAKKPAAPVPVGEGKPFAVPVALDQPALLRGERARASFDVAKMTAALYGGEDKARRRRFILGPLADAAPKNYDLTREEGLAESIEHFIGIHKAFPNFRPTVDDVGYMTEMATRTGSNMPSHALFLPTVVGQASERQLMSWLPKAVSFGIVGAYCQTELGHGSNIRSLQTTATFDPATGDFVLHSHTVDATKWWNSGTGCVATHGAVYARLIIRNVDYGVHCFFVQLRDENHIPLPGIEVGDTGSKMGDDSMDTGFIRFNNVRVPRQHLMSKRQHVTRDGRYVRHVSKDTEGAAFAGRMTMVRARASTIAQCSGRLSIGFVIAARYSIVRKQGFKDASETEEAQIIDYQVQRFRVLRQCANMFAFRYTAFHMSQRTEKMAEELQAGGAITGVDEIHALSSGLKAYATRVTAEGLEDLRRSCGGHGFLLNSGIASLFGDFVWIATAEGDQVVLALQLGRWLLKQIKTAEKGGELPVFARVLAPLRDTGLDPARTLPRVASADAIGDLAYLEQCLAARVLAGAKSLNGRLNAYYKANPNAPIEAVINSFALDLDQLAINHAMYFCFHNFREQVNRCEDAPVRAVLERLCSLYGLAELKYGTGWVGLLSAATPSFVEQALARVLDELRPDVAALADACEVPDTVLNSTLGRSDGDAYNALLKAARESALNKHVPFIGYERVLKPHLDHDFLKLRGAVDPDVVDEEEEAAAKSAKL